MLLTANLATPLYKGYSDRLGFSPAVLGLIFATYAIVLIPSLLIFGQLSDQLGRRRVIAAGLGVAIVGLVLFAAADSVWWLFAARATQGLAGRIGSILPTMGFDEDRSRIERPKPRPGFGGCSPGGGGERVEAPGLISCPGLRPSAGG